MRSGIAATGRPFEPIGRKVRCASSASLLACEGAALGANVAVITNRSTKKSAAAFVLPEALLAAYAASDRINRYLIENLSDQAWRADPPAGKGRTIAAIAAHIHNVRLMWLKVAAEDEPLPDALDRATVTRPQAIAALEQSHDAVARLIAAALAGDGRIRGFRPDVAGFLAYLISHDAHHRGQISMLARQVGHPLSQKVMFGLWEWGSR